MPAALSGCHPIGKLIEIQRILWAIVLPLHEIPGIASRKTDLFSKLAIKSQERGLL